MLGGNTQLQLHSYNPTSLPSNTSFFGDEADTRTAYTINAGGLAVEFRAKLDSPAPGYVMGLFLYSQQASASIHSEIDVAESLSNDAVANRNQIQTNIYANEPLGPGIHYPSQPAIPSSITSPAPNGLLMPFAGL